MLFKNREAVKRCLLLVSIVAVLGAGCGSGTHTTTIVVTTTPPVAAKPLAVTVFEVQQ